MDEARDFIDRCLIGQQWKPTPSIRTPRPPSTANSTSRSRIAIEACACSACLLAVSPNCRIAIHCQSVGRSIVRFPGLTSLLETRLYLPDEPGPSPTVEFFHGGGFVFGDIATHDQLCRQLTRESRCAVVSVAYRLAPEHPFPAAVEDAYAAVEWAAANPDAIGRLGKWPLPVIVRVARWRQ